MREASPAAASRDPSRPLLIVAIIILCVTLLLSIVALIYSVSTYQRVTDSLSSDPSVAAAQANANGASSAARASGTSESGLPTSRGGAGLAADDFVRGNPGAAVTIIEYSDYECPFCRRAEATTNQILATYGDRVRFVYRDFPLPGHENAIPAALAANCAGAQGKFWEYHDLLFVDPPQLDASGLYGHATQLGLDMGAWSSCMASQEFADAIGQDMAAGQDAGVQGTPYFFINDQVIGGAAPYAQFAQAIESELS